MKIVFFPQLLGTLLLNSCNLTSLTASPACGMTNLQDNNNLLEIAFESLNYQRQSPVQVHDDGLLPFHAAVLKCDEFRVPLLARDLHYGR